MKRKYKKIVVLDSVVFYPEHRARLAEIAEEVVEYNTCETEAEVVQRAKGADCLVSCWVDISNRVIDENPQLITAAFWTHAFEHRIDKNYAQKHNIYVPSIPDYGTDSVAELTFIGLLQIYKNSSGVLTFRGENRPRTLEEEIMAKVTDDVRKFNRNCHDNLRGSWFHEYIKGGKLKVASADELEEETLKGLTVGLLVSDGLNTSLAGIAARGLHMNVIYSLGEMPHSLETAFRPIDNLLRESQIIVYDSRAISPELLGKITQGRYRSTVDLAGLKPRGQSLLNRRLGIIGAGRIGGRVAQIARDAFAMEVSYYSRSRKPELERQYGLRFQPLESVLSVSDIVTFHLPHVGAEKFITREMINLIPKDTTLVNVSVGNIFQDQDQFLSRFVPGDLNGYFDVYETLPPRQALRAQKQCLLSTYRLGWRTKSTLGLKTHKLISRLKEGLYRNSLRPVLGCPREQSGL